MVGTFFAWAIPLLMIAGGIVTFVLTVLAGAGWNAPGNGSEKFGFLAWAAMAIALIGLLLTGLNIWELFR